MSPTVTLIADTPSSASASVTRIYRMPVLTTIEAGVTEGVSGGGAGGAYGGLTGAVLEALR